MYAQLFTKVYDRFCVKKNENVTQEKAQEIERERKRERKMEQEMKDLEKRSKRKSERVMEQETKNFGSKPKERERERERCGEEQKKGSLKAYTFIFNFEPFLGRFKVFLNGVRL